MKMTKVDSIVNMSVYTLYVIEFNTNSQISAQVTVFYRVEISNAQVGYNSAQNYKSTTVLSNNESLL